MRGVSAITNRLTISDDPSLLPARCKCIGSSGENKDYSAMTFVQNDVHSSSLTDRLKHRMTVERRRAGLGHALRYHHLPRTFERNVTRRLLKFGLQITRLYPTGLRNALTPVVRKIRLHFADLPAAFDGFQILHLSDLHIDGMDGLTEALIPLLGGLKPDLCVITGDYRFDDEGPREQIYPRMRSILSSISTKHGVFGILGNHDTSEIAFGLADLGMRMLINDAAEIRNGHESAWLIGVDDPFRYRCDDLASALTSVPLQAFKILLAHTPELYRESSDCGIDLYLCGHTHAGQIRLPGIGSLRHNANCPKPYAHGHWAHGDMQGYTSAGIGCSMLPIRFNCPPEIVLVELAVDDGHPSPPFEE
jgi:predicted MPP superfamily phosphohydrolase